MGAPGLCRGAIHYAFTIHGIYFPAVGGARAARGRDQHPRPMDQTESGARL
jgi:hypothetical protein